MPLCRCAAADARGSESPCARAPRSPARAACIFIEPDPLALPAPVTGLQVEQTTLEQLGTARKVTVANTSTTLIADQVRPGGQASTNPGRLAPASQGPARASTRAGGAVVTPGQRAAAVGVCAPPAPRARVLAPAVPWLT